MVAVQQPRADCGHGAALTQQCGRCLRWCCPECYFPWTALACGDCRAEARAAQVARVASAESPARRRAAPAVEVGIGPPVSRPCRSRGGARPASAGHRHREHADVRTLADRVAALERRLRELQPGS